MADGRIVFVTFELYPLTGGGIGRALYNIINSVEKSERDRVIVVLLGHYPEEPQIPFKLREIDIRFADINDEHNLMDGEAVFPPRWAFSNSEWHWRSYVAFRALQEICNNEQVSYIEFTDWGGLGYCSIQEKMLGNNFSEAQISVRLHGPHSVLLNHERYIVNENDISIFDLEKFCLKHCDIVIAQTRPYFDTVRETFGFNSKDWNERYFYSPLPVIVENTPEKNWISGYNSKNVLFTSKFQHIKRPEIFVRGVSGFLNADEGKDWNSVFCAKIADADSKKRVLKHIPDQLLPRFFFEEDAQGTERNEIIARSVVVVSSACESFCLAAFEASLLGALVVLNERNPSFGNDTLWLNGENCLKYDGTAAGLTEVLKKITTEKAAFKPVEIPPFNKPWGKNKSAETIVTPASQTNEKVSIIIYGVGDIDSLIRTMRNCAQTTYKNAEIILALTADDQNSDILLLKEKILEEDDSLVKVVFNDTDKSIGGILNKVIVDSEVDVLLFVHSGDLIHNLFLNRVMEAFSSNERVAYIGCHVGAFDPQLPPHADRPSSFVTYDIARPEASMGGYLHNMAGHAPFAIHRHRSRNSLFDEELTDELMWSFQKKMQSSHCTMLALNAVYAFRDASTWRSSPDSWKRALNYHEMLQTTSPQALFEGSSYLLMSLAYAKSALGHSHQTPFVVESGSAEMGDQSREILHEFLDLGGRAAVQQPKKWWSIFSKQKVTEDNEYDVLNRSGAFDEAWYRSQYPDVVNVEVDPLLHYIKFGAFEGRLPNPHFDSQGYLAANPDVANAKVNPLYHYIVHGRNENRNLK